MPVFLPFLCAKTSPHEQFGTLRMSMKKTEENVEGARVGTGAGARYDLMTQLPLRM